jgi:apolipoprotein N-acyltransferase
MGLPPRCYRRNVRALARAALSAAAGVLVWTSFPPLSWWPAAIVGVGCFAVLVRAPGRREAALAGWAFGLGSFVPMLSFLRGLGVDAWLVPAAIESLWFVALALAVRRLADRRFWPLGVALLWVAAEWLRDRWPFGGFPWGRLAFGQADGVLLPLAALGGAPLLTFAVALLGAAGAWTVERVLRRQGGLSVLAWPAGALAVLAGGAALVPVPTTGTSWHGQPAHAVIAVVQGNVPRLGLGEFAQRHAVTVDHEQETLALAADVAAGRVARPQLVIWPENASDEDPFDDPVAQGLIEQAVAAIGVPILVGAVLDGPGPHHVRNAAVVWSPATGPGEIYVKRHLVPFGEYLPFRTVLSALVGRFSMIPDDFVPGHRPGVLTVGPVRLGDVICYEVADDEVVRQAVTGGGRLITVQTNNATYEHIGDTGRGGETAQQLEMSRIRAVEHGRAVVVAATSGVSAIIGPDGTVLQRSGVFTPARLVADLPLRDPRTVSDRLGAWPERVAALAGLIALVATVRRRPDRADAEPSVVEPPVLAGNV